jgi:hypothetical protein
MVLSLCNLYPSYVKDFKEYEEILRIITGEIYAGYIARFIRHEFVKLPQEMWFIAKDLHDAYIVDPIANKISHELVVNHINSLSAVRQNYLIRAYRQRQEEANPTTTESSQTNTVTPLLASNLRIQEAHARFEFAMANLSVVGVPPEDFPDMKIALEAARDAEILSAQR